MAPIYLPFITSPSIFLTVVSSKWTLHLITYHYAFIGFSPSKTLSILLLTMTFLKAAKKNNWPLTRVFGSCTQTNASFYQQIQKSVLLLRLGQWPGVGGLGQGLARRLGKSCVGKRLHARGRPFLRTHLLQWTMCCPLRKSRPLKLDNFFEYLKNVTIRH